MQRKRNVSGGGKQTNINGIAFENLTDLTKFFQKNGYLSEELPDKNKKVKKSAWKITKTDGNEVGLILKHHGLYRNFLKEKEINWNERISKKMLPDNCFISASTGALTIIEKKTQFGAGSVDEKLQTADFKLKMYKKLLSGIEINGKPIRVKFCFLLDEWYKKNCYSDVLNYIKEVNCSCFFGEVPLDYLEI